MKNIPMFTTEAGVASLILEEIPYKKIAYIKIQSSITPEALLEECVSFCTAVGAERIYASGHEFLQSYPLYTEMLRMECDKAVLAPGNLNVCWIDENNVQQWCDIYNRRMYDVPNAATLTIQNVKKLIPEKVCCLVYEENQLLGIGKLDDEKVDAIASVVPGRGVDVMRTLCGLTRGDRVVVEVAGGNIPAIRLYEKLGFQKTDTISTWYCIK